MLLAGIVLLFAHITPIVVEQTGALLDQIPEALENLRYYFLRCSWGDEFIKKTEQPENLVFGFTREDLIKRLEGMAGFFAS